MGVFFVDICFSALVQRKYSFYSCYSCEPKKIIVLTEFILLSQNFVLTGDNFFTKRDLTFLILKYRMDKYENVY